MLAILAQCDSIDGGMFYCIMGGKGHSMHTTRRNSCGLFMALTVLAVMVATTTLSAGEKPFSWTNAPAKGFYIEAKVNAYNLSQYMEQCLVNRPEIVAGVKDKLDNGEYYRKTVKDQKGKNTILTMYVDIDHALHIITYRDEICDKCNGTGMMKDLNKSAIGKVTDKIAVGIDCLYCKGKGVIPNKETERYFVLSSEDYENAKEMRQFLQQKAYTNAPEGTEQWVERLVSENPRERLAACEWLDQHYVRVGQDFQSLMPMLKKARYQETSKKHKSMVWQFWAGKGIPEERDREYYRIYVDSMSGKVETKGFYKGR